MLVMIDGPMITRFIDSENFRKFSDDRFRELDEDHDGKLVLKKFSDSMALDIRQTENAAASADKNEAIDVQVFRSTVTDMLKAIASGLGPMPLIFGVEEDSMLMKAYENELGRVERKLDEVLST